MSPTKPLSAVPARPPWVIPELDARGEIDRHAAMCLQHTIHGAPANGTRAIVIDLRDLTSIDAPALEIFVRAHVECQAAVAQIWVC